MFRTQVEILPPSQVRKDYCPVSGEWMSEAERKPPNRTTRCLKEHVYQEIISRVDVTKCAMCNCLQDSKLVADARSNPREIEYHLCDECFTYLCLVSAAVHGNPVALKLFADATTQIACQPLQKLSDVIELHPKRQPLPVYAQR